jgi:predicted DCC family thiol-disulfide oxidoreductase YuxK
MNYSDKNIVFYDGDCGFCNWAVQFVLKWERKPEILFSAFQSEFAKKFFKENNAPEPDFSTFYFYTNYTLLSKSSGALQVIRFLKFPFPLLQILRIIPICFRDRMYDAIAKRRQKIAKNYCFVPDLEQRKRFID